MCIGLAKCSVPALHLLCRDYPFMLMQRKMRNRPINIPFNGNLMHRTKNGPSTSEGVRSAARHTRDLLKPSPEIEQCEIPKGRGNQRNSERQGVVAKSSRQ